MTDRRASDAELLARSAADPQCFAELYRRHVDDVLRYLVSRTADGQVAARLCAETFAAAFAGRDRFVDTGAPVGAWLIGIARNQLGTYARRERVARKHRRRLGIADIRLDDDERDRIEAMADFSAVRPLLDTLSPDERETLELRVGLDLPYTEVATRLGISEGAARVRVSRALARLREEPHR